MLAAAAQWGPGHWRKCPGLLRRRAPETLPERLGGAMPWTKLRDGWNFRGQSHGDNHVSRLCEPYGTKLSSSSDDLVFESICAKFIWPRKRDLDPSCLSVWLQGGFTSNTRHVARQSSQIVVWIHQPESLHISDQSPEMPTGFEHFQEISQALVVWTCLDHGSPSLAASQKLYARNIKLLVTPPLVAVRESIAKSVDRADLKAGKSPRRVLDCWFEYQGMGFDLALTRVV